MFQNSSFPPIKTLIFPLVHLKFPVPDAYKIQPVKSLITNLGSQFLVNPDLDADAKKKAVMDAVHMQFKPEFINLTKDIIND